MEPCTTLKGVDLPTANEFSKARDGDNASKKYLCPRLDQKMKVVGDYTGEQFSYLKVAVFRCEPSELPEGSECKERDYFKTQKSHVQLLLPEATVNYDKTTEDAVEWTLNTHKYIIRYEEVKRYKQNVYISQSRVYFENKWNLNEIGSHEKEKLFL